MEREPHDSPSPDPGSPAADGLAAPRFVWPPRPLPTEQAVRAMLREERAEEADKKDDAADLAASPDLHDRRAPSRPDPPTPSEPGSAALAAAQQHAVQTPTFQVPLAAPLPLRHRLLDLMRQVELAVLQPEILTLAERARGAGWMPEAPASWCPRCGEPVGPHEWSAGGCRACHKEMVPWDRFVRLGPLEGELRQWVHEIKFARGHRLARELGRLLGSRIAIAMGEEELGPGSDGLAGCVVSPVPTTYRRRLVRGIDHARQIALGVSESLGVPCQPLLARAHTRPQRGLSKTDRLQNARGVFRVRREVAGPPPRLVVLVDDVRTTGATLGGCVRELQKAMGDQVQFCVATLAVTKPERDR